MRAWPADWPCVSLKVEFCSHPGRQDGSCHAMLVDICCYCWHLWKHSPGLTTIARPWQASEHGKYFWVFSAKSTYYEVCLPWCQSIVKFMRGGFTRCALSKLAPTCFECVRRDSHYFTRKVQDFCPVMSMALSGQMSTGTQTAVQIKLQVLHTLDIFSNPS